jgi:hypothetical protein
MARPFRLPVNQADHVRVEGLSRLERHFATRFAVGANCMNLAFGQLKSARVKSEALNGA